MIVVEPTGNLFCRASCGIECEVKVGKRCRLGVGPRDFLIADRGRTLMMTTKAFIECRQQAHDAEGQTVEFGAVDFCQVRPEYIQENHFKAEHVKGTGEHRSVLRTNAVLSQAFVTVPRGDVWLGVHPAHLITINDGAVRAEVTSVGVTHSVFACGRWAG